ncbi:unnamed protein product [Symbiodinium natans]|uniref:Uncharacterized protein n=1 Tax=Symbiodinium natans TaxID=878477 RepID=A0A812J9D1_9DINO|nr:unnamed protein product [Symbiodinium natans]
MATPGASEPDPPSPSSPSRPRQPAPLVELVLELQEELRAYLFLFMEVACLGQAAPTCSQLRNGLWSDAAFWKAYAGVCLKEHWREANAAILRERFRVWLFHLEGEWEKDFAEVIEQDCRSEFGANFLQLLQDARYIASGLMPADRGPRTDQFVQLVCSLLSRYNPKQLDERWAAESCLSKVEQRTDVFADDQVSQVAGAFAESLERSMLEQHLEGADEALWAEPLPEGAWQTWELEEEDPSEDSFPGMNTDFGDWSPTAAVEESDMDQLLSH